MKKVLLVAYHFPPIQGSTGVSRTLAAARYLPQYGWSVGVLTVEARAYEAVHSDNDALIPEGTRIERAWALDARKHLSVRGRYPLLAAIPDRWSSWVLGGFVRGTRMVRDWEPDLVMSTYPIASAHCIAYLLHRAFRIPWVAELRDPMAQADYPKERVVHRAFEAIERRIFSHASRVVVTTDGCAKAYRERFADYEPSAIEVIPNGFEPEMFPAAQDAPKAPAGTGPIRLLHSGLIYPEERDPTYFFQAFAELLQEGDARFRDVHVLLRGCGNVDAFRGQLQRLRLHNHVSLLPSVSYQSAVEEMMSVDGLLLLQARNCNHQIPAKLYEYCYTGRPVLAMTDPEGDTGRMLKSLGVNAIAPLESVAEIKTALSRFIHEIRIGACEIPRRTDVAKFSRRELTARLGQVLDAAAR